MTRAERAAEVARLRGEGLVYREIAEHMGISRSYATNLGSDPDGSGVRARKDSYRGTCEDCGAPTDGSNGIGGRPRRCNDCERRHRHENRYWTPERIAASMRAWAKAHGRPPNADDWRRGSGIGAKPLEWAPTSEVQREFGSWSEALVAAGFPGYPVRYPGDEPDVAEAVDTKAVLLYESGLTAAEVAARLGVSDSTVWLRVRAAGGQRSRSEAQRLRRDQERQAA